MRKLGLDIGDKRIGVAISDPEDILATPLTTIVNDDDIKVIADIVDIVTKYKINQIVVNDLKDNTYYATIYLTRDGQKFQIDSRPSDAIAIALRTKAKIFMEESVIEKSRKIDLSKTDDIHSEEAKKKWAEILENLDPEDFGKYKM